MATIKIEINTDTGIREGDRTSASMLRARVLTKPMIVVTTIHLNNQLRAAFEATAGQTPAYHDGIDYSQIAHYMSQVDGPNRLIVTGGGLIAFLAAKQYIVQGTFVSLLGMVPTGNLGNCYGGVSLNSFGDNSARVDFLVNHNGRARAGIGLFCNPNSPITPDEVQNWATIAGVNQTIAYGGNTGGHNNSTHYLADLNGADPNITTMIISADPFFQDTKDKLIGAANQWVTNAPAGTRYVCYPFADYSNTNSPSGPTPTHGTASWYGPSLLAAYGLLGTAAALAETATSPLPFSNTTDTWGDF